MRSLRVQLEVAVGQTLFLLEKRKPQRVGLRSLDRITRSGRHHLNGAHAIASSRRTSYCVA